MIPKIKNLQITVIAESPVRVGGSRDPVRGVDQPMATVAGKPVIPGASLKGALRFEIASYLIGIRSNNPSLKPCIPTSTPSLQENKLSGFKLKSCVVQEISDSGNNICPVCYLLGAQGLTGFVTIPFLYSSVSQEELTEISVDYSRRTARSGGLRSFEFVPTKATFNGVLQLLLKDTTRGWEFGKPRPGFEKEDSWLTNGEWTPEKIEKELIKDRLETIQMLGGFKSKGFGKVKITVTPL